jgi:predicted ferric reductase
VPDTIEYPAVADAGFEDDVTAHRFTAGNVETDGTDAGDDTDATDASYGSRVTAAVLARRVGPMLLLLALGVNIAAVTGGWLSHGGWPTDYGTATLFTALGQITALWGTLAALVQILLVARVPGLDGRFGMDRLIRWHRWVGFALVWCLLAHIISTTVGWAAGDGRSFLPEFVYLNSHHTSVLLAGVGTLLLVLVAATSVRAARRKLSREVWFYIHLLSYAMMALSFPHIVQVGSDFDHHRWTTYYWSAMYLAVLGTVIWHRFGNPVRNHRRHRFTLTSTREETPGVVSLRVAGDGLHRFSVRAGQFVTVRFVTRGWFHRAHPFSISAVDDDTFRVTVKALGDDSARIGELAPGTKVIVEGPYGAFTEAARTVPKVLLIAGGIGITPVRMLFERLGGRPGDVTLLYRSSSDDEIVFRDELEAIAREKGHTIHHLVGNRVDQRDAFTAESLERLVPDVARHDVYLCGPHVMVSTAVAGLRKLGVPTRRIHYEDFSL